MKILSLFDGISCARVALDRAGILVEKYYASEIDKYAISISQKNYPDIIQIGDVKQVENIWKEFGLRPDIDLLIGGSPCQDLSIAKKNRKGLKGEKSSLFYEYVRILNEIKPKYFVLENVASMPKADKEIITKELYGIEPIMINAALVSAQNRKRLFWVGKWNGKKYEQVIIPQPEDKNIFLKDILEINVDEKFYLYNKYNNRVMIEKCGTLGTCMSRTAKQGYQVIYNKDGSEKYKSNTIRTSGRGSGINDKHNWDTIRIGQIGKGGQGDRIYSPEGKSVNLSANGGGRGAKTGLYLDNAQIRKLTPVECERLQSLPDNYTEGISNTQRYKALGNGFNVEVIAHILKYIKL